MLKKNDKSPQNSALARKPSVECSLCNKCDSGHVLCENCHQSNGSKNRQDSGDCVSGKKRTRHTEKQKSVQTISPGVLTKDFASGDYEKRGKASTKKTKSKSDCKINVCTDHVETKSTLAKKNEAKEEIDTTIEYKNLNYKDDRSSTSSLGSNISRRDMELITELPKLLDLHVCPRWYLISEFTGPVQCPVEACNKMIALDSVMLHFYFDHSKVPRMTLSASATRQLCLKPSNLSSESQCLCIFSLQENKVVGISSKPSVDEIHGSDSKSVLLMAAKMPMEKLIQSDEKSYTHKPNIHVYTTPISNTKCKSCISLAKNEFNQYEFLLLWLCKQDDNTDSYSISVLSRDKKQGFSYIGEAIHIRNTQSPAEIFNQAYCLIVSGTALNRLLDEENQFSVIVNFIK